ncbi:hypothetical protein C3D66_17490 [Cronobacter sakazakii]|nr:hypothetical protein C3D66_17490 [Cronobacter sakazakii]
MVYAFVILKNQFAVLTFRVEMEKVLVAYRCPVFHMDNQVISLPLIKINRFRRGIYSHNAGLG